MRIITYSLSVNGPSQMTDYHEQLCQSVKSLRAYNGSVPVHVFLYGEHPRAFITELEREAVGSVLPRGIELVAVGERPDVVDLHRIARLCLRALADDQVLDLQLCVRIRGRLSGSRRGRGLGLSRLGLGRGRGRGVARLKLLGLGRLGELRAANGGGDAESAEEESAAA